MFTATVQIFALIAHLVTTLVRLALPGGVRAVIAESLLLKHQLLILNRSRNRAPRLTPWDRLLFGVGAFLVASNRLPKIAIGIKPATLLRFHRALIQRKYRLLFTSRARQRPGPKGPSGPAPVRWTVCSLSFLPLILINRIPQAQSGAAGARSSGGFFLRFDVLATEYKAPGAEIAGDPWAWYPPIGVD
jgi:hypothetical protein